MEHDPEPLDPELVARVEAWFKQSDAVVHAIFRKMLDETQEAES